MHLEVEIYKKLSEFDLDVHFKIDEICLGVMGPSGSGKSMTLKCIAGIETPDSGRIVLDGRVLYDSNQHINLTPQERNIGYMFQNYALFPNMTVYDNMAFGLKMAKTPKDEIDKRVREAAEKLEITQLLDRKPKEMSGGQRQRVAVGRAIVRKPDVFLFDEPLSNLDAKLRVSMRVKITQLHKQLKAEGQTATMIYVTHDQVEAMTMGDRICVLNYGKIMQVDTPLNLYHKPANKFVAGFIGSPAMNFVDGVIEENEDGIIFIFGNSKHVVLPKEMGEKVKSHIGKKVILGIRPENIGNKVTHPEGEKINFLKGQVSVVEHMGNEEFLYFTIDGCQFTSRIEARKTENVKYGEEGEFYFLLYYGMQYLCLNLCMDY